MEKKTLDTKLTEATGGKGLHYNTRRAARAFDGKEHRHGSGIKNKTYAQACGGSSSVKK